MLLHHLLQKVTKHYNELLNIRIRKTEGNVCCVFRIIHHSFRSIKVKKYRQNQAEFLIYRFTILLARINPHFLILMANPCPNNKRINN